MEFTPQETKLIARLRKQQRQWAWARWVCLGFGLASVVLCAMFGFLLHSLVSGPIGEHPDGMSVLYIVLIWTKCCIYFGFALCFLIMALTKWHGDASKTLLLKLLDAQEHQLTSGSRQ
jgi:hypothetical protein